MRKILIFLAIASVFLLNFSCNSSEGLNVPTNNLLDLSFPTDNFLCIENTVAFDWADAFESETSIINYTIIIAKDRTLLDVIENSTVNESEITVTLDKATAYYWKVIALNTENNEEISSDIFSFYTKGEGILNYAPFASEIVEPIDNSVISVNSLDLKWIGSDADFGDVLTYELYFSETATPALLEDSLTTESYTVATEVGKTYYWKVNVVDEKGAKSIGQIWSFTVN
ncbi:MAG: hypothetical protein ABJH82_13665 [Polaribacter sp.]|uniref:hypothetical protein n=1 Tax=Polaribacter sp. TaxID=1920175 RepID=UPI003264505D